jgi:dipeptidyl aminopeptidase/acylaminoacyl peptidase
MTSWLSAAIWTIDAIMGLASPSDPQLNPEGTRCAYVWRGDIYSLPMSGGAAVKVAAGRRPRWSLSKDVLTYLGRDGQVHTSDGRTLTSSPTPVSGYVQRGGSVFYLAMEPKPASDPVVSGGPLAHMRLYRQGVAVSKPDWHVVSFDVSPDASRAVCAVQRSPLNRDVFHIDLYEIQLATGEAKAIVEQPGRDAEPSYSRDGRTIAFHSQGGTWNYFEARHVAVVPSGGGPIRYLTAKLPYDVFRGGNAFTWSKDSREITYTAGSGTTDVLIRQSLDTLEAKVLTERIAGPASFSADGKTAVYVQTSAERPPELARLNGEALTELQKDVAVLPKFRSRVVKWRSSDGLDLEGILWLPIGYQEGKRVPLLAELHGGPTGVALHTFPTGRTYPTQVFLQQGTAVFVPNFRGSSNYGAPFRLKNALSQGKGDYQDVMSGVDHLVAQGIAHPDRLGVMGWSYGGYLTGAVITQTNRFKAASVGAPAVDWASYYGQFDGSKEVLWTYFGGTPWEVPENYARHSTRAGLKNIRTPTLLQVGALDLNHNSEIYQALTDLKVPVEYVVYPREGHGITEPAHQRDLMERNLRWFTEWLKK